MEKKGNKTLNATFIVVPRFNMATLVSLIEPMRVANYLSLKELYSWEISSFEGPVVLASNGMEISTVTPIETIKRQDLIFIVGSWGCEHYARRELTAWVRKQYSLGAQICSVELGCYIVARAGLLAGKKLTTHWSWLPGFQEQFSEIEVSEQLFTINDKIISCAGGFSGIDLMLKLIRDEHGSRLSGEIADQMLYHPPRSGGSPQRQILGRNSDELLPLVAKTIKYIEQNISEPATVPELAHFVGVSQRQLERQFNKSIGCSVVQFGLLARLQHARVLLIATKLSVREIATASGFNTLSHFAYAFKNCFGRRPSDYRMAWPESEKKPSWPGTLSRYLENLEGKAKRSL
ncbi:MAG: GlxA family transcriptional regulator [Paracoccaceae bacterium]|nr:GlxA family transcriptional regulator [Paracoccaceae bacterium]